jgi:hypothetical protein
MHPPKWVEIELERIMGQARLGWDGERQKFALIELRKKREQIERDLSIGTPWKSSQGPIFGSRYDLLSEVPIYIISIDIEDVFSGKILALTKRWMTPFKDRVMDVCLEAGKETEAEMQDLTGEAGEYLDWHAHQSWATSDNSLHLGDVTEADKKVLSGEGKHDFTETFVPNNPEGGKMT